MWTDFFINPVMSVSDDFMEDRQKDSSIMPKLFEYLGIIIMFYSNEHEPIHVHGKFQGMESKAELIIVDGKIVDVLIKEVAGRPPLEVAKLRDFKHFVSLFADQIVQKWVDYFVYHKSIQCIKIEGRIK
jgi:hypothetical protein